MTGTLFSSKSLKRLEERLKNDRQEIECDISYTMVRVCDLIDDVRPMHQAKNDDRPEIHVHGDWVEGDKMGGDKIGRGKTQYN